jgi:hypothetical protein
VALECLDKFGRDEPTRQPIECLKSILEKELAITTAEQPGAWDLSDSDFASLLLNDVDDRLTNLGYFGRDMKEKILQVKDRDTRLLLERLNHVRRRFVDILPIVTKFEQIRKPRPNRSSYMSQKDFEKLHTETLQHLNNMPPL